MPAEFSKFRKFPAKEPVEEALMRLPIEPETIREVEAFRFPDTCRVELTDEEAVEMKPPVRVARLVTPRVEERVEAPATMREEEALKGPDTFKFDAMEEEALETNPSRRPAESMEKRTVPAEFPNCRKSPVADGVEEAKMRTVGVEVPRSSSNALGFKYVDAPKTMASAVSLGFKNSPPSVH